MRNGSAAEHKISNTSTGHVMSDVGWLDLHFAVARAEYVTMIRSVGILPCHHVLDAGCGCGSFLPLIGELVGKDGTIAALDLAPENVATVRQRLAAEPLPCRIDVQEGSILRLPYTDCSFDVVWCANVVQYLEVTEFAQAAAEFHRVLKRGGVIALKEMEMTAFQVTPLPPPLMWHLLESQRQNDKHVRGMHTLSFPQWLRAAGFSDLVLKTYIGEDRHPLSQEQAELIRGVLAVHASLAAALDIAPDEKSVWQKLVGDFSHPQHVMNDPDFYFRRPYALVLGRKP